MIKILIIEDEIPARNKLKRFISELELQVEIVAEIDTVEEAIFFENIRTPYYFRYRTTGWECF
jgi:YesN/AraC family two-component response regulator